MSKCGLCGDEEMATHTVLRCKVPFDEGMVTEIEDWMLEFSEFEGCEDAQAASMLSDACTLLHSISMKVEEFVKSNKGK